MNSTEEIMREIHKAVCLKSHAWQACNRLNIQHPALIDWNALSQALAILVPRVAETEHIEISDGWQEGHEQGYTLGWTAACETWGIDPDAAPTEPSDDEEE